MRRAERASSRSSDSCRKATRGRVAWPPDRWELVGLLACAVSPCGRDLAFSRGLGKAPRRTPRFGRSHGPAALKNPGIQTRFSNQLQ